MNELGTFKDYNDHFCSICNEKQRRYTCPHCGVNYCSLNCYKSESHQECSEFFYKNQVEMEMKINDYNPEKKKKMLEILKRLKKNSEEQNIMEHILNGDEDSDEFDSDDEEDVLPIEKRLKDINLDNVDELWSVLTDAEKQEFEAIIQNNDFEKILPNWTPWWEQIVEKKLVRDLNEIPQYEKLCPTLVAAPNIKGKMKVSPYVQFNLMNVIYSYVYTVLHFFGDHLNSAKLATQVFLYVCDNINKKKVFTDSTSAAVAVYQHISGESNVTENIESGWMLSIKQGGDKIIHGPKENCCYYVLAALSDIHTLLSKAKDEISLRTSPTKSQFHQKFQEYKNLQDVDISKKIIQLHLKKIEFYLAWVNLYGKNMCG